MFFFPFQPSGAQARGWSISRDGPELAKGHARQLNLMRTGSKIANDCANGKPVLSAVDRNNAFSLDGVVSSCLASTRRGSHLPATRSLGRKLPIWILFFSRGIGETRKRAALPTEHHCRLPIGLPNAAALLAKAIPLLDRTKNSVLCHRAHRTTAARNIERAACSEARIQQICSVRCQKGHGRWLKKI